MGDSRASGVERAPVKSSNIASIGYDSAARLLDVEFKSGSIYRYHDVVPETHAKLMAAESIGRHLHAKVKGAHKCTRLDKPKKE